MDNGKKILFLFLVFLIVVSISIQAVEKHPIVQGREDLVTSMYSQLCQENPFSRYCLFTTGSTVSPLVYDPYLIEEDFVIPSPVLVLGESGIYSSPLCDIITNHYTCQDDNWFISGRSGSVPHIVNGELIVGSAGFGVPTITSKYLKNFKNRDIKFKFWSSTSATGSGAPRSVTTNVYLGNKLIVTAGVSARGKGATTRKDFLVEVIKDVTDSNKFIIIVNGEPTKEIIIEDEIALLDFRTIGSGSEAGGSTKLSYIKSRAYFSCEVNNNEIVISDRFGEGSTFDIHDLTFEPTKFCPLDYPAVVRDFKERGVKADVRGTITEQLTRGKEFTVPSFQAYEIRYITTFKPEMGFRCDPFTDVYDTTTKTCVQKIFEQDFIIKLADSCDQVTCNEAFEEFCEDKGDYVVCIRPFKIIEIIRDREIIKIGKNQKFFENSLTIGGERITSSRPTFTCPDQEENWNSPDPSSDCWKSSVSFDGDSFTMGDRDEIDLNDFFKLKLIISAHYDFEDKKVTTYTNNFILTIKDFDLIKTEVIKGTELDYYVIKDSTREMCFKLINNLGISFGSDQSGYGLLKDFDLIDIQPPREVLSKSIPIGTTNYCIPIDSERYGELFYQVNPYFKLGDEIFFDDEQITYNYKIVDEIPTNETIVFEEDEDNRVVIPSPPITSTPQFPIVYLGIGTVVVLVLYFIFKRK